MRSMGVPLDVKNENKDHNLDREQFLSDYQSPQSLLLLLMDTLLFVPVADVEVLVLRMLKFMDSTVLLLTPILPANSLRRGKMTFVVNQTATVEESGSLAPPCTCIRRDVRCKWTEALLVGKGEVGDTSNW